MDLQLVGKTALVSGSTARIGLAIASGLAREGTTVYINGRTEARVLKTQPVPAGTAEKNQHAKSLGTLDVLLAILRG